MLYSCKCFEIRLTDTRQSIRIIMCVCIWSIHLSHLVRPTVLRDCVHAFELEARDHHNRTEGGRKVRVRRGGWWKQFATTERFAPGVHREERQNARGNAGSSKQPLLRAVYRSILMSLNPPVKWPDNKELRDNYMKAAAQLCALFRCHGDQRDNTDASGGRGQSSTLRESVCVALFLLNRY